MNNLQNTQILAVDGGGTHCRFALVHGQACVMFTTPSTNVHTDLHGSVSTLLDGLQGLAKKADASFNTLCGTPAFVGLAGLIDGMAIRRLASLLPLHNVRYADDRPAALRGALGNVDGIIAHCGTGSFFASQINGKQQFVGGWGSTLGDEASAMWIGRQALSALLKYHDGMQVSSPFIAQLLAQFTSARSVLDFADTASPKNFGELAPTVTHYAQQKDPVALSIMHSGAQWVANEINQLGWDQGMPICLTGGLGHCYYDYLPSAQQACVQPPKGSPLDGAIAFAQDKSGGLDV